MIDLKDRIVSLPGSIRVRWDLVAVWDRGRVVCPPLGEPVVAPAWGDEKGRGRLLRRAYTEYGREQSQPFKANEAFAVDVECAITSESYEGIGAQQRTGEHRRVFDDGAPALGGNR